MSEVQSPLKKRVMKRKSEIHQKHSKFTNYEICATAMLLYPSLGPTKKKNAELEST